MSYIRKVISTQENLVLLTRLHWIYLFEAFFWLFLFIALGLGANYLFVDLMGNKSFDYNINLYYVQFNPSYIPISWGFYGVGLAIFTPLFIKYISTEVGLTSRRIIHKRGLIMIEILQVELEDIRGEQVHHGWLGWLLGYGRIHFDCRFIDDVILPAVYNPYRLVKAVHTARMRHEAIPFEVQDLDAKIVNLDTERFETFRAHERLKRMGRRIRADFNSQRPLPVLQHDLQDK